jgi:hypothetical protein
VILENLFYTIFSLSKEEKSINTYFAKWKDTLVGHIKPT